MLKLLAKPGLRRYGLIGLIALAVVLVGAAVVVMVSDEPFLDPSTAFLEPVIPRGDKPPPEFVFPERVRTTDLSLNRFVDRFARVCTQAKYSDFRLMLSSRAGDPIVATRFESMFNALKQVRILAIDKAADLPSLGGPVYIMSVEYDLEPSVVKRGEATEKRKIAILRENGEWRIGPVPREALTRLEQGSAASQPAASQPARREPMAPDQPLPAHDRPPLPQNPKAAANAPAKLD